MCIYGKSTRKITNKMGFKPPRCVYKVGSKENYEKPQKSPVEIFLEMGQAEAATLPLILFNPSRATEGGGH